MKTHVKNILKSFLQSCFKQKIIFNRLPVNGLVLTFDDGPHPIHTPIIIDTLAKRGINAIFFVTGKELEQYPEMGRLIVQHGHILGNHTYEHLDLRKCDFNEYLRSIKKTYEIISLFQSPEKRIFRPPYGSLSLRLITAIVSSKSILMNWTVDSRDSFIKEDARLVNYVKTLPITQGDILLFHEDYPQTMRALPEIIDHLTARITISGFSEWI